MTAPTLDRVTKVEMRLLRDEQWLLIDTPETSPAAMFDWYLRTVDLSCCSLQGGLFIDVGARPWSDGSTSDELHLTMIWFDAMLALLGGADTFGPAWGPCEEVTTTWSRIGDDVTMGNGRGGDMMWSVTVDLKSLALGVADRGRALARWSRDVRTLARAALRMPRTAKRAAIVDKHVPSERGLQVIDELVARIGL